MKALKNIVGSIACLLIAGSLSSCLFDPIDDDLSKCGQRYDIIYRVHMNTNLDDEIATVLTSPAEQLVATRLYEALTTNIFNTNIFTEKAQELHLSFYDVVKRDSVKYERIPDVNSDVAHFEEFYVPAMESRHLAVANTDEATTVSLAALDSCHTAALLQTKGDTINSQSVGLFTARKDLDRPEADETYQVDLYMANSAAAIVIDTTGYKVKNITTYIYNMSDGFALNDSTYTFNSNPYIRMNDVSVPGTNMVCRYGACFPSRDSESDPDKGIWQIYCYVTLEDGTTTQNILTVSEPLLAGNIKIITAKIDQKGVLITTSAEVGVSVTLDWKQGGIYTPTF